MNQFEKVSFEQFRKDMQANWDIEDENKVLEIYNSIQLPRRGTSGSAGYDFYMPFQLKMCQSSFATVPTGIRVKIDHGMFLMCVPRSGLGFKYGCRLVNTCGIIDEDYYYADNEGHIMAKITCDKGFKLASGDRFMQGIFVPYAVTADDDPIASERTGGFGSTGGTS